MRILISLALVGVSLGALQADEPKAQPPRVVLPVGADFFPGAFLGRVEAVTEETVTIKPERDLRIGSISFHPDGTIKEERLYVQDNTKPAKTFVFSDPLLAFNGTLPSTRRAGLHQTARCGEHKISDVRPGDIVYIEYRHVLGKDLCIQINIQRRPGGRVPPAYDDDKTTYKYRVDTRMNAAQFFEEKGIPKMLPRLFLRFRP